MHGRQAGISASWTFKSDKDQLTLSQFSSDLDLTLWVALIHDMHKFRLPRADEILFCSASSSRVHFYSGLTLDTGNAIVAGSYLPTLYMLRLRVYTRHCSQAVVEFIPRPWLIGLKLYLIN